MATQVGEGSLRGEFFLERQKQGNWCWAAIGVALALYFHNVTRTQCKLVQATRNPAGVDCCATPDHPECDTVELISRALAEVNVARRNHPAQPEGPIAYDSIREDIGRDRPVICLMSGPAGEHYVIIVGWFLSGGAPWLVVDDPADGFRRRVSYSDFFNFSGRVWAQTTRLA